MKVKSPKLSSFQRSLLIPKTTVKRDMITVFSSRSCNYRVRYSSYEYCSFTVLLQNFLELNFSQCCMILRICLGTVYQTMKSPLNDTIESQAKSDSFALMKRKNVNSNVIQPETNKTNKMKILITSTPYTAKTPILSSGTVYFKIEKQR